VRTAQARQRQHRPALAGEATATATASVHPSGRSRRRMRTPTPRFPATVSQAGEQQIALARPRSLTRTHASAAGALRLGAVRLSLLPS